MNNEKVLLLELKERTSTSGHRYLSGWLGKASVVGFSKEIDGEQVWQVYVQTPTPKPGEAKRQPMHGNGRVQRVGSKPVPRGQLNDDISDIGFGSS